MDNPELTYGRTAAIQLAGCRPLGTCAKPPPRPGPHPHPSPSPPGPVPPGETLGPTTTTKSYNMGPEFAKYARAVPITVPPGARNFSQLMYYDDCTENPPMTGVSMGLFSDSSNTGTPHELLSLAGHWAGGDAHCVTKGWRMAPLRTPVTGKGGQRLWLLHWYAAGAWNTVQTQGTHHFAELSGHGLPDSLDNVSWTVLETTGVPLRARLGPAPPPGPPPPPAPPSPPPVPPSPPPAPLPDTPASCAFNGEVVLGRCSCDPGWKGRGCDVLDERPTLSNAGYAAPESRSTWLGSVVRRDTSGDYALLVDDIQGHSCAGEAAYYLTSTALATSSNPLGGFQHERVIAPQVSMHPTATTSPVDGATVITTFTNAMNRPLSSSFDCSKAGKLPCVGCQPNPGYADANMTLSMLVGNASAPQLPWKHIPILTSQDLPRQWADNSEAIWGLWDPSHVILSDGTTFVSTAHGNLTRGVFLFRAPSLSGPFTPVGDGPVIEFEGSPVRTCDPFMFHTAKRGGALHIIADHTAIGYIHAVAPGPSYSNWSLTAGSKACLRDQRDPLCELAISNSIRLRGGGTIPHVETRQSLTILFDSDVPVVVYTNLIGAKQGKRWTAYKSCSSLNAVPVGAQGDKFADKLEQRLSESDNGGGGGEDVDGSSCKYPAVDCVSYPPCELGGSTRPTIKQHVADTQMPPALSPGRLTEAGEVLNAGNSIYSNITIRGNTLRNGGRFLDIGVTSGIVVEGNTLMGPSKPSSNIRLYSSAGFDTAAMVSANVCKVQGKRQPCVVDARALSHDESTRPISVLKPDDGVDHDCE
jgi:hypothetical protein